MDKLAMTEMIMAAKKEKKITWDKMADDLGFSPVWLASVCLGMNSASPEKADAICKYLDVSSEVSEALKEFPDKTWEQLVAKDPLIYRFYEIAGVYGESLKQVIQEKFGDGIMSAIDFKLDVRKEEDPKGDRVVIEMNGKFLPYKSW